MFPTMVRGHGLFLERSPCGFFPVQSRSPEDGMVKIITMGKAEYEAVAFFIPGKVSGIDDGVGQSAGMMDDGQRPIT